MPENIHPRPKTIKELRQMQLDLYQLAKPFVRAKCDILSVSLPSFIRYPDGRFETIYDQETTDALARIDKVLEDAVSQYVARNSFPVQIGRPK